MKLSELRTQTRDLLGDVIRGANPTTFSEDQVKDALNYACRIYCQKKQNTYKDAPLTADANGIVTVTTGAGGAFVYGFFEIDSVHTNLGQLDRSDIVFESRLNRAWRTEQGIARRFFELDGHRLQLVPRHPNASVTVGGYEEPVPMAGDGDTPDPRVSLSDHDVLKYAAAAYLLLLDGKDAGDLPLSQAYMDAFDKAIGTAPPPPKVIFRSAPSSTGE